MVYEYCVIKIEKRLQQKSVPEILPARFRVAATAAQESQGKCT
jgi:hypothetical protein